MRCGIRTPDAILAGIRSGSMPCDGAWPEECVEIPARWIEPGKAD
jgi:hypothetical protein